MAEPLFLKCECSTHALEIQYDQGTFDISLWHYGRYSNVLSWRERLRWIWRIIRTGNPWTDAVILDNEKSKELVKYITTYLPKE